MWAGMSDDCNDVMMCATLAFLFFYASCFAVLILIYSSKPNNGFSSMHYYLIICLLGFCFGLLCCNELGIPLIAIYI